jgi:hypothetical protein
MGIQFSNHYGSDGSGFGYLKFKLEREVGIRYTDIGFGYIVVIRKALNVIYKGMIREIGESTKNGVGTIAVSAVGLAKVAEDAPEILRNFCNADLSKWVTAGQVPGALYRPDLFTTSSSDGGLILTAGTQPVTANQYTELVFEFFAGEVAERIKFDALLNLGRGVTFDADVDSIDAGNKYIFYKNNSDETKISTGTVLVNITQSLTTTIDAVDTGLNRLTVSTSPSSWAVDDEIYIQGPYFTASIVSVASGVITYTSEVGEGNLSTSLDLINLTKKDVSGITSYDAGANTITATDDVTTWTANDTIIIPAPLFSATVSGVSGTQITYTGESGERVVNSDTGWVLHNTTEDDVATVASWTGPDKLDVTVSGEISTWNGDTINIYSPYRAEVRDSNNAILWPTDWRSGAVSGATTGINVTSTGSPTTFRILFKAYIAGSGDESSFARLSNVKVYSTELDCTMETIAKAMLSNMTALGIDSSEDDIAAITKVVEPSVFEFKDIKAALSETAKFGSQNGNQVAWGIRPNDVDRFFVEEFPTGVKYIIAKSRGNSDVEVSADMGESVQRIRGVYTDPLGNRVIMDWVEETDQYFGSYYISRTETLQNIDNDTDAQAYIQMLFNEQKRPPVSSAYTTKGDVVQDIYGNVVPFDEVVADGSYIEVEDFRAAITGQQVSDLSANWVRDRLVAVEVDVDNKSVKLIPGKARKTFEIYMAELSRIAKL